jgi:hypothetical protein
MIKVLLNEAFVIYRMWKKKESRQSVYSTDVNIPNFGGPTGV